MQIDVGDELAPLLAALIVNAVRGMVLAERDTGRPAPRVAELLDLAQRLRVSELAATGPIVGHRVPGSLTVAEAAEALHADPRSVRRWCSSGRLPARRVGRQWLIDEETVWAATTR